MKPGEMVRVSAFEDAEGQRLLASIVMRSFDLSSSFNPLAAGLNARQRADLVARAKNELRVRSSLSADQISAAKITIEAA